MKLKSLILAVCPQTTLSGLSDRFVGPTIPYGRYTKLMTDDRTDAVNYDVAISFLTTDEPLALELADNLTGLEVFVYSKEQETIGGTDGLETFGHVFRDDSRIQAVLYRDGWGATPWTRVEAMAIRDKCLSDGFDNLVFVRLDDSELPD